MGDLTLVLAVWTFAILLMFGAIVTAVIAPLGVAFVVPPSMTLGFVYGELRRQRRVA